MTPAFLVVFGLFVASMVAITVIAVRWAVCRDRAARRAGSADISRPAAPAATGHDHLDQPDPGVP